MFVKPASAQRTTTSSVYPLYNVTSFKMRLIGFSTISRLSSTKRAVSLSSVDISRAVRAAVLSVKNDAIVARFMPVLIAMF